MPLHRVYGLTLVANHPLPGVPRLATTGETSPDVEITLGEFPPLTDIPNTQPWYVSSSQTEEQQPNLQVWGLGEGKYWFLYGDRTEFLIQHPPTQIWAKWPSSLTLEDTATYLLGPVLMFVLRLRGITCLHASAVCLQHTALAFVGPAGAGKSTTAAAFAQLGYPVLSDDGVPLFPQGKQWLTMPAYPRLRLWPESVGLLYGHREQLPRIVPTHPTWDKRYLDLTQGGYQFQSQPFPLSQVYLFNPRTATNAPSVQPLPPTQALLRLIANTSVNYLLTRSQRQQEFQQLTKLVQAVSVYQITPHPNPTYLPQLLEQIICVASRSEHSHSDNVSESEDDETPV
ncbi:hypothetical protein PN462_02170 [Spirulina sp. CS-785/01]|uniref:hypothetical protein n=1 Tax=Spirulina sp. CS-785/01 TaxID=3021716 RepID=UPI00232C1F5F|nr:hypothetical protein [Spirulina sp. CS-785/01]MDB9311892.1 hypothetical protein [Spirulina sp. CS-785/01]